MSPFISSQETDCPPVESVLVRGDNGFGSEGCTNVL